MHHYEVIKKLLATCREFMSAVENKTLKQFVLCWDAHTRIHLSAFACVQIHYSRLCGTKTRQRLSFKLWPYTKYCGDSLSPPPPPNQNLEIGLGAAECLSMSSFFFLLRLSEGCEECFSKMLIPFLSTIHNSSCFLYNNCRL